MPRGSSAVGPPTGRLRWLDLARGLAVVSMVIAHTSPWGGVFNVSEYLSAPWFAFLMGCSFRLATPAPGRPHGRFVVTSMMRGTVLVLLGVGLQAVYAQIDVVLAYLGLLTIVLAALAEPLRRAGVAVGVAAVVAVVSPVAMTATRAWLASGGSGVAVVDRLAEFVLAGPSYRVLTLLAFAAAGMAATAGLARVRAGGRDVAIGILLGAAALAAYGLGRLSPWGSAAYSGSTPEIVGATLLSASATWLCAWVVAAVPDSWQRVFDPFVATGRMALTAYTAQILVLAAIVGVLLPGQRDDHWWVLLGVLVVCVGGSWAWLSRFRTGPLEVVVRLPARFVRGFQTG